MQQICNLQALESQYREFATASRFYY